MRLFKSHVCNNRSRNINNVSIEGMWGRSKIFEQVLQKIFEDAPFTSAYNTSAIYHVCQC